MWEIINNKVNKSANLVEGGVTEIQFRIPVYLRECVNTARLFLRKKWVKALYDPICVCGKSINGGYPRKPGYILQYVYIKLEAITQVQTRDGITNHIVHPFNVLCYKVGIEL